jgi:hypothetical protein
MKPSNLVGVVLSGTLLVATLAVFFTSTVGAQPHGSAPVTVVNTPLPVTGNILIDNNTPIPVRDVDSPALQPFRTSLNMSVTALNQQGLLGTVPAGKRLVLEHVSWGASMASGQQFVFAAIRVGEFGPLAERLEIHPPHVSLSSSFNFQEGATPTRQYFEAGDELWVAIPVTSATSARFEIIVSGHLIDL